MKKFALGSCWLLLVGCAAPEDIVGVGEIVTEVRKAEPLQDDSLSDKHPVHDPSRTVVEQFDGCAVTLNKSASVTRLTLQSQGQTDEAVRGRLFASRAAALAALGGAPTLPSVEVVNGALKPFNDGLYAAVELAAEHGDASLVDKHRLLIDLLAELMTRSQQGAAAEKAPALAAAKHIATALTLAGKGDAVGAALAPEAAASAEGFQRSPLFAKPIGFYTWTPELAAIFTRDRWLQSRYVPGVGGVPFDALAALGLVAAQPGPLSDAYRRSLDLYAGLTDPFFDASPFQLAPFVPSADALADLPSVERSFAATLPTSYPGYPSCNPGVAAFPASESAENRMMRQLLCGQELAPGETLLDGLIRKIQAGQLDLAPRANSGFYDQQLYALETLLVPERGTESRHLLLTRAYKQKLVETFKSLLIQTRETHVKQLGLVDAIPASAAVEPVEYTVYPRLVVEPLPTFYLRTARAYRFLEGVLDATLGSEFLSTTSRLREDGLRAEPTLRQELAGKQRILYGLHAVSADSIGMATELALDEEALFPLDVAREAARTWLAGWTEDPDVARDPRVSLPVALETVGNVNYAIYWGVVGIKVLHLHASFPDSHRPEVVSASPYCVQKGWAAYEPHLLVDQTVQMRRRADLPPLSREEFRALCDQHADADAIAAAFESAP